MCIRDRAEDACTVEVRRGVGFYHVALADIPMPWEMLDNWALGYLCGEESVSYTHLDVYKRQL